MMEEITQQACLRSSASPSIQSAPQNMKGFTLIEMMIVAAAVALLVSIAIPSYHKYILRSNEAQAMQKMLSLSNELEQWRAKALSYRGFIPQEGYADASTGTLNVPISNGRYEIKVGQVSGSTFKPLTTVGIRGNSWVIMATPVDTTNIRYFKLNSTGVRCANIVSFDIEDADCKTGQESW